MQATDRSGFVYVIQDDSGLCKIGRAKDVAKRIRSLSTGCSSELKLIASWPCDDAAQREATMHEFWSDCRVRGEWFRIPDNILAVWKMFDGAHCPTQEVEEAQANDVSEEEVERFLKRRNGNRDEPGQDGRWWVAAKTQTITCQQCSKETQDAPAVMKYDREIDHGGIQAQSYPDWPRLGWVVWRQCEFCSWMDFHTEYRTLEDIRRWKVGPWRPN